MSFQDESPMFFAMHVPLHSPARKQFRCVSLQNSFKRDASLCLTWWPILLVVRVGTVICGFSFCCSKIADIIGMNVFILIFQHDLAVWEWKKKNTELYVFFFYFSFCCGGTRELLKLFSICHGRMKDIVPKDSPIR